MGFPVPLGEWARGPIREFLLDTLATARAQRAYLRPGVNLGALVEGEASFGRGQWALLCLEIWQQAFHDQASHWGRLRRELTRPDRMPDVTSAR